MNSEPPPSPPEPGEECDPHASTPVPGMGNERTLATLIHLLGFAGLLFPFVGNLGAPLVMWLLYREDPLVDRHGREVLNFQISFSFYYIVLAVTVIGLVLVVVLVPIHLVLMGIAAVKTSNGEDYRYPWTFRLL